MAGLSVAAVLVAGCDKGTSTRLYTDDELAALEAKARPNATRDDPSSVTDISMLALGPLQKTLDQLRNSADPSAAAQAATEHFGLVRKIGAGRDRLVRLFVVQRGERMIADTIDELVDRGTFSPAVLDSIAMALDRTIASELSLSTSFEGDWRWLRGGTLYGPSLPTGGGHDPRDERALDLAMIDELQTRVTAACPQGASLATCHRQLPSPTGNFELPGQVLDRAADQIRSTDEAKRHRLQAELVRQVADNQITAYQTYADRSAAAVSRLIALRIHLELLRRHTCDVPSELLTTPVLGDNVSLTRTTAAVIVSPPTWVVADPFAAQGLASTGGMPTANRRTPVRESWTIACP